VKERPILFSAPMVRALLDGRKTQTRRVVKPQSLVGHYGGGVTSRCPYGVTGDRLWVRETWCQKMDDGRFVDGEAYYFADDIDVMKDDGDGGHEYRKDGTAASPWCPSIHMPRWASRILLEVTDVRVQRVQEITSRDAWDEGVKCSCLSPVPECAGNIVAYKALWNSINAQRGFGWDVNPWVWAITFKKL
jgi:hypothetical protein